MQAGAAARAATLGADAEVLRSQLYTLELQREERRVEAQRARESARASKRISPLQPRAARRSTRNRTPALRIAIASKSERERLRARILELSEQLTPLAGRADEVRLREIEATQAVSAAARAALDTIYADLRQVEAIVAERAASEAERKARLASTQNDIAPAHR